MRKEMGVRDCKGSEQLHKLCPTEVQKVHNLVTQHLGIILDKHTSGPGYTGPTSRNSEHCHLKIFISEHTGKATVDDRGACLFSTCADSPIQQKMEVMDL